MRRRPRTCPTENEASTSIGNVEVAFDTWERKGVTQLRHSHVFLGKLVSLREG